MAASFAALAIAPLAACGLGEREAHADAIADGVEAAIAAGSARGTVSATLRVIEVPDVGVSVGGIAIAVDSADPAELPPFPPIELAMAIDFEHGRSGVQSEAVLQVFDGLDLYGIRHAAAERDARPWVLLDLEGLDDGDSGLDPLQDPPLLAMNAISPVVLVDLASGPLTGSIEHRGEETVAGVRATRYEANFDIEKVLTKSRRTAYDEDRREAVERLFDALGVKGTVHPGEVWIDEDGLLRRFDLRLRVEPIRRFAFEVGLRIELTSIGEPVHIDTPAPHELLQIDSLVAFLRSVVPAPEGGGR